jgi:hypothetical protein
MPDTMQPQAPSQDLADHNPADPLTFAVGPGPWLFSGYTVRAGLTLIVFAGSGFVAPADVGPGGERVSFHLELDGVPMADTFAQVYKSSVWTNEADSHKATVPRAFVHHETTDRPGSNFAVVPDSPTGTDLNDVVSFFLLPLRHFGKFD